MASITIDSELLAWPPIKCEDESVLRNYVRRGENRIMPGANGRRRVPLLLDQLDETLTFKVAGLTNPSGTPNVDVVTGLEENLEHYRSLFLPDIAHDLSLSFAGDTFTGEVQIPESAQVRTGPLSAVIVARFVITAGELASV